MEVVRKVATSFFCLLVFLSVCKVFPVERNIDDDFTANMPFYAQVVYLYLSMLTTRPKYYFVWTLGGWLKPVSFLYSLWWFVEIKLPGGPVEKLDRKQILTNHLS